MKIKICGIRRLKDVQIVNKYLPDFVGFVFYKKSPRNISPKEAKVLSSKLDDSITPVGVFLNENPANIVQLFKTGIIDIVQLHGDESEEYIDNLKKLAKKETGRDLKVIKTVVFKKDNLIFLKHPNSDYYLFNLADEEIENNSIWESIRQDLGKPFFLSGDLSPENIIGVLDDIKPYAIDVSSASETNNFKDEDKIKEIVGIVRENF